MHFVISKLPNSSPNHILDHLLELSHQDDSNMWFDIGFGEEITQVELIKVDFMHLIWSSGTILVLKYSMQETPHK